MVKEFYKFTRPGRVKKAVKKNEKKTRRNACGSFFTFFHKKIPPFFPSSRFFHVEFTLLELQQRRFPRCEPKKRLLQNFLSTKQVVRFSIFIIFVNILTFNV